MGVVLSGEVGEHGAALCARAIYTAGTDYCYFGLVGYQSLGQLKPKAKPTSQAQVHF